MASANDDRQSELHPNNGKQQSAVVTIRSRKHAKHTNVPETTPKEYKR